MESIKISYHEVAYEFYKYYPIAFEPGTAYNYTPSSMNLKSASITRVKSQKPLLE